MRRYFQRKLGIYALTFFVAVTIDWLIPRFMPGDPVQTMLSRASLRPEAAQSMQSYLNGVFGLDYLLAGAAALVVAIAGVVVTSRKEPAVQLRVPK